MSFIAPKDETAIAGFFNASGRLRSTTVSDSWDAWDATVQRKGQIRLACSSRKVNPNDSTLECFLALAEATDDEICAYINRHGALHVFWKPLKPKEETDVLQLEYAVVYRYFARAMLSVLKLAAQLQAGHRPSKEDWSAIADFPELPFKTIFQKAFSQRLTQTWADWLRSADHIAIHLNDESSRYLEPEWAKVELGFKLDALLHLADARIRFSWGDLIANPELDRMLEKLREEAYRFAVSCAQAGMSDEESEAARERHLEQCRLSPLDLLLPVPGRPRLEFQPGGLFGYLALQLCLRVAGVESFILCSYCGAQYTPDRRAPKANQANFCPSCRKKGIPNKLALKRFRDRQRTARDGKTL